MASDGGNSCSPLARPASRILFSRIQRSQSRGWYFRSAWLHPGTIVQSSATENLLLIFTPVALVRYRFKQVPADSRPPPSGGWRDHRINPDSWSRRTSLACIQDGSGSRPAGDSTPAYLHRWHTRYRRAASTGPPAHPRAAKHPRRASLRPPWQRLARRPDRDEAGVETRAGASEEVGTWKGYCGRGGGGSYSSTEEFPVISTNRPAIPRRAHRSVAAPRSA